MKIVRTYNHDHLQAQKNVLFTEKLRSLGITLHLVNLGDDILKHKEVDLDSDSCGAVAWAQWTM